MTRTGTIAVLAASLLLFGAGCSSDTTSTTETPAETSTATSATPSSTSSSSSTSMYSFPGVLPAEQIENKQIRLHTEKGDIVFELFADTAPKTVSNFVYLTTEKYYDGLTFHRREPGFVIQGGDPRGTGTGGPGYKFEDELKDNYTYERGIVAMANSGPNTNGSQFFIMLKDTPLPHLYSIFGRVTEGLDVVDKIAVGDKMLTVTVEDK